MTAGFESGCFVHCAEPVKVFIVVVWYAGSVFVYAAAENGVCEWIAAGGDIECPVDKLVGALCCFDGVEHNRKIAAGRIFIPTGISMPLAVNRCC